MFPTLLGRIRLVSPELAGIGATPATRGWVAGDPAPRSIAQVRWPADPGSRTSVGSELETSVLIADRPGHTMSAAAAMQETTPFRGCRGFRDRQGTGGVTHDPRPVRGPGGPFREVTDTQQTARQAHRLRRGHPGTTVKDGLDQGEIERRLTDDADNKARVIRTT